MVFYTENEDCRLVLYACWHFLSSKRNTHPNSSLLLQWPLHVHSGLRQQATPEERRERTLFVPLRHEHGGHMPTRWDEIYVNVAIESKQPCQNSPHTQLTAFNKQNFGDRRSRSQGTRLIFTTILQNHPWQLSATTQITTKEWWLEQECLIALFGNLDSD